MGTTGSDALEYGLYVDQYKESTTINQMGFANFKHAHILKASQKCEALCLGMSGVHNPKCGNFELFTAEKVDRH